jgi:hypothetical protein
MTRFLLSIIRFPILSMIRFLILSMIRCFRKSSDFRKETITSRTKLNKCVGVVLLKIHMYPQIRRREPYQKAAPKLTLSSATYSDAPFC